MLPTGGSASIYCNEHLQILFHEEPVAAHEGIKILLADKSLVQKKDAPG
jgi:hypothetical protein